MLDCKLCNYYEEDKRVSGKGLARCDFAGVIFMDDVENLDIPYPCRDVPLSDYYERKRNENPIKVQELKLA